MKRIVTLLASMLVCSPLTAQTALQGQSLQPQWGDGFTPISAGTHTWQVKNDSGQTWTLHGVSFYADTGASQLVSVHDDVGHELLQSKITGTLAYAPGTLTPGATIGYGHALILQAVFDGVTTIGQADVAVTHPQVDGTETASFSAISTTSPVAFVDGCINNASPSPSCSLPDVTKGGATIATVSTFSNGVPTLTDNGTTVPFLSANTVVTAGGMYVYTFTMQNESSGAHSYSVSFSSAPRFQSVAVATFSGASTTSPFDIVTTAVYPITDGSISCPQVKPTSSNEYVGSFAGYDTGGSQLAGVNLTSPPNYWTSNSTYGFTTASGTNPFAPAWQNAANGHGAVCTSFLVH